MTRLLCTADLHIGAGSDYADDRLQDQEDVLTLIVDLAQAREVDLCLIAGDVFHRPRPTPSELHAFARFVRSMDRIGVPTIAILGNAGHDQDGHGRPAALELFEGPRFRVSRNPERITEFAGVTVCTLPSIPVTRLVALLGGGDRHEINEKTVDYLLKIAADGLRPACDPSKPCLLLGHWSVSCASLPNGLPVADLHEPVLPLREIEAMGFDAVVLGHIHKSQPLSTLAPDDELMPIFYTGSPMVTNYGEAGFEHGVWQIDLCEGQYPVTEFVPLADRSFVTIDVDFTEGDDFSQLLEHYGDWSHLQDAVVRVRYRATEADHRRVDQASLKRALLDLGAHRTYQIVPEIIREQRARADGVDETLAPESALDAWIAANELAEQPAESLRDRTRGYLERSFA